MRRSLPLLALLMATLLTSLTACGFQPVHSSTNLATGSSTSINIPQIDGRTGHELRKALMEEFAAGLPGIDNATLTVTIDERLGRLAIRPDEAAARSDLRLTGRYILDTGDDAISGEVRAETSFNVPDSAFGDIASQKSAADRAALLLAQRLADDLKLKLLDTK